MLHSASLRLPGGRLVVAPLPPHFAAFPVALPGRASTGEIVSARSAFLGESEARPPFSLLHGASWLLPSGEVMAVPGFHEEWIAAHEELSGGARNVCELVLRKRWISVALFSEGYLELMVPDRRSEDVRHMLWELLSRNAGAWSKALVMSMDEEGYAMIERRRSRGRGRARREALVARCRGRRDARKRLLVAVYWRMHHDPRISA